MDQVITFHHNINTAKKLTFKYLGFSTIFIYLYRWK